MHYKTSESTATSYSQVIHDGDGEIKTTPLFRDVLRLPVNFAIWELAPGVSEGGHVHQGEDAHEELYYFIEGEGIMWADGEDVPVKAGDAVLAPEGSDHGFRNTGRGLLKLALLWGKPDDRAT
ncbi:MAG: cupin domain-containing protein [SAR202 cluster bacterium]|nr:cupin domain-containing protein [SAR202 cluster bacterium]